MELEGVGPRALTPEEVRPLAPQKVIGVPTAVFAFIFFLSMYCIQIFVKPRWPLRYDHHGRVFTRTRGATN